MNAHFFCHHYRIKTNLVNSRSTTIRFRESIKLLCFIKKKNYQKKQHIIAHQELAKLQTWPRHKLNLTGLLEIYRSNLSTVTAFMQVYCRSLANIRSLEFDVKPWNCNCLLCRFKTSLSNKMWMLDSKYNSTYLWLLIAGRSQTAKAMIRTFIVC